MGFLDWFKPAPSLTKRATRHINPAIVAYYWNGGSPVPQPIKEISVTGAYLLTAERWYVGTIVTMTLERETIAPGQATSLSVAAKVVRHVSDGVGVHFMLHGKDEGKALQRFVNGATGNGNGHGRNGHGGTKGQAAIEFTLMIPVLFFLIVNALNFGGLLYAWITVANAARSAAQYAVLGNASVGAPTPATSSAITALIQSETSSLPGSTPTVTVCIDNNGTGTTQAGATCSTNVQDPEKIGGTGTATYTTLSINVTYSYVPLINTPSFLGYSLSLGTTTIQRRTVMRKLN
jgi:Flp pilus assembly protein TadG